MISFDEFLKQDDEEKYNNAQMDMFEIQALKTELENRDIYISKLEVAYSKEIERLNNIIDNAIKKLNKYRNRKDTWGLWCMEYGDNAEIIKILGGEVKNE